MLRLRLALPLVRRRLLDLRVRLGACACSTLLAQDDTAGGRNHGICTNNVRMQTKRLLLGMEKLSALLTDEVVHKHTALAIPLPTGSIPTP